MNERTRRLILGLGVPIALASAGLGPYLVYRSELPDRVASHFDVTGRPDGSMTPELFLFVIGGLMAVGLAGCVAVAVKKRPTQPMFAPILSFGGVFLGTLSAGILLTTALGQRGLQRWQDSSLPLWVMIPLIGAGVIAASLAARVASSLPYEPGAAGDREIQAMPLTPGERVFWSSTITTKWPLLLGAAVLLLVAGIAQFADLWVVLLLLVIAKGLVLFSRVRVTADQSGLHLRYGFVGWPRTSIPIHRIASARAIEIRPADWGGWGYRGGLGLMKRAAVVLRAGPGIRVNLHDGKVFAVTIDDPEIPVRLLNAEILRLASAQ
jgi:hypothetical protein